MVDSKPPACVYWVTRAVDLRRDAVRAAEQMADRSEIRTERARQAWSYCCSNVPALGSAVIPRSASEAHRSTCST